LIDTLVKHFNLFL